MSQKLKFVLGKGENAGYHEKREYIQTREISLKFIFSRISPLFGLRIFSEIFTFFDTPNITKHIYLELIVYLHYQANIFNSLPNDKILDWSKLKAHADDKLHVTQNLDFVLRRV